MIKNSLIVIATSLLVTSCSSEKPEPVTVKAKDGTEAIIRVTDIHRYPQDYDEGTPCRTAPSKQDDPKMAAMEPDAGKEVHCEQPNQAIEYLLLGLNKQLSGIEMQSLLDGVVSYRAKAVPYLIEAYEQTNDELCWPLVYCLCKIQTPEALEFVRGIMQEHTKQLATLSAIKIYPEERDDEIIGLLIDLLNVREYRTKASEKLQDSIYRKPERAGQLVAALKDDPEFDGTYIYGVLADVSAYRYSWTPMILSSQDRVAKLNNFWRAWWERNKDKDVFGWLEEAASSKNETRQTTALQRMRMYADERAMPYYIAGLDNPSKRVQYQSIVGLRSMEGSYPSGGYRSNGTELERLHEILRLKKKYASESAETETSTKDLEALQYASAMAGRSGEELAELRHRDVPPAVRKKLHALFKEYYPDVNYEYLDLNGIRFEYKTKRVEYPLARKGLYATYIDHIPEPAGIRCTVGCMQGPYAGPTAFVPRRDGKCPSRLIKESTHNILIMNPYCEESDVHLGVSLEYPPDTSADFLKAFKQIMEHFVEGCMVDENYLSLTSSDGTMIHAKVLSYDENSDMAVIEDENHEQRTIPSNYFCNADAALIRNWKIVKGFLSETGVAVFCTRDEPERRESDLEQAKNVHVIHQTASYIVGILNRTGNTLKNVRIETCMHISITNADRHEPDSIVRYAAEGEGMEEFNIESLTPGKTFTFTTKKLWEENLNGGINVYGRECSQEVVVSGIWIRMFLQLPDGNEVMREFKNPTSIWEGFVWTPEGPRHPEKSPRH